MGLPQETAAVARPRCATAEAAKTIGHRRVNAEGANRNRSNECTYQEIAHSICYCGTRRCRAERVAVAGAATRFIRRQSGTKKRTKRRDKH